jgi:hypothetical protein
MTWTVLDRRLLATDDQLGLEHNLSAIRTARSSDTAKAPNR